MSSDRCSDKVEVILSLLAESASNQIRFFAVRFVSLVCLSLVIIFFIFSIFKHYSFSQTTVANLLACLGNTGGAQRHIQLSGCLVGVSLPATTTAQQIIDILGTIPIDSRRDDLVDLLKNNKITISGQDATNLLSAFGSEPRRSFLIGILCYIKRPIPESDKNELLKGIDPMYVYYVRQQLEKSTNPPCEN